MDKNVPNPRGITPPPKSATTPTTKPGPAPTTAPQQVDPFAPLIETVAMSKNFISGNKTLVAIKDLSLRIYPGEILGLVGESGCGKSTAGRTILHLYTATSGDILYRGKSIESMRAITRHGIRRKLQMIFQDPYASLNPRMTVEELIGEPLDIHKLAKGEQRRERILKLMDMVGLPPDHITRYPHEFSGGQRQRIGIARALAVEPEFIVLDEPISALDVSIQAQIVNLLKDLRKNLGLTYLFIAHDLSMVQYISDRVAVMYLGHLVEIAPTAELYKNPLHPYTQALLGSIPIPDPTKERKRPINQLLGEPPSPIEGPQGCPFVARCPRAMEICKSVMPDIKRYGSPTRDRKDFKTTQSFGEYDRTGHYAACHAVEADDLAKKENSIKGK